MDLPVLSDAKSSSNSKLSVSDRVFDLPFNEDLVHQVVTSYLANAHQGTKAQKSRSERRGGGTKPWRQKGSGRARAGTIRSPLWRKGGVAFAAEPVKRVLRINRKAYRAALSSVLSELIRQERFLLVDDIRIDVPKTKCLIRWLKHLSFDHGLIVTAKENLNLNLSARNVPNISLSSTISLNPVALIVSERVVFTVDALKKMEEHLL